MGAAEAGAGAIALASKAFPTAVVGFAVSAVDAFVAAQAAARAAAPPDLLSIAAAGAMIGVMAANVPTARPMAALHHLDCALGLPPLPQSYQTQAVHLETPDCLQSSVFV